MAQIREIKKRMVAVKTIQRITKTMQMIATAKFTAALQRSKATRPYTDRIRQLVGEVSTAAGEVENPLLGGGRKSGRELILVVTSDRGLCGAYNGSVLRRAMQEIRARRGEKRELMIETVGKKASSFFKFQRIDVAERHSFGDKPVFDAVATVAQRYMDDFSAGKIDAVHVVFMRFVSAAKQIPDVMQLLPLSLDSAAGARGSKGGQAQTNAASTVYEFVPSAAALLDELLPKSVKVSLFQALNDAIVSENVMRMVAMKAATDNAGGLGRTLKRNYNRARQAKITTELTEIIAGAAALE
jgi:F-type H+-transporting ATPase subunit gamma